MNYLNQIDHGYRGELRELNESNFVRFDAKLEQRLAELKGEMEVRFAAVDAKLGEGFGQLRAEIAASRADLIKWMFAFWAPTALAVVALVLAFLLRG